MSHYHTRYSYFPVLAQQSQQPVFNAVKNGAMIGMTGATALGLYQLSQGQTNRSEAVKNVIKTGASVGLAAGAAKAAGSLFEEQPVASLLASFAAGTAVAYALTKTDAMITARNAQEED